MKKTLIAAGLVFGIVSQPAYATNEKPHKPLTKQDIAQIVHQEMLSLQQQFSQQSVDVGARRNPVNTPGVAALPPPTCEQVAAGLGVQTMVLGIAGQVAASGDKCWEIVATMNLYYSGDPRAVEMARIIGVNLEAAEAALARERVRTERLYTAVINSMQYDPRVKTFQHSPTDAECEDLRSRKDYGSYENCRRAQLGHPDLPQLHYYTHAEPMSLAEQIELEQAVRTGRLPASRLVSTLPQLGNPSARWHWLQEQAALENAPMVEDEQPTTPHIPLQRHHGPACVSPVLNILVPC